MTVSSTRFIFGIQACSDAYIALSEEPGQPSIESYEFGIGTRLNMHTEIRSKRGTPYIVQTVKTSCMYCVNFPFLKIN